MGICRHELWDRLNASFGLRPASLSPGVVKFTSLYGSRHRPQSPLGCRLDILAPPLDRFAGHLFSASLAASSARWTPSPSS
eukprot:4708304-Prymnesium_polylepis.1